MNLIHRIAAVLLVGISLLCAAKLWAEDEKSPTDSAPQAEYRQVHDEWEKSLTELAELQIKIRFSSPQEVAELSPKYVDLVKKTDELATQLQASAEKAYIADDQDAKLGLLLFTMAVADLRKDYYEDALRLAKLLIEHNYQNKEIYRVAGSAAFAMMQLDDAKKYLDAVSGDAPPTDPHLAQTLAGIDHYRPKWEREEKFRAAEAKADDLPRVKLHTSAGDIVVELFENEAPNTVANFISLVEKGFYDGTQFHRVLPNFMAQTGDPISKDPTQLAAQKVGSGGPPYTIEDECNLPNHREHFQRSLSMAHTAERNSGGSQFFITFVPQDGLDGQYTVFGRVIEGLNVLPKIQRVDPDPKNYNGVVPDKLLKAEVLRKRDHPYEPKTLEKKMTKAE